MIHQQYMYLPHIKKLGHEYMTPTLWSNQPRAGKFPMHASCVLTARDIEWPGV